MMQLHKLRKIDPLLSKTVNILYLSLVLYADFNSLNDNQDVQSVT